MSVLDLFLNFDIMRQAFGFLLQGLGVTLVLCADVVPAATLAGLVIAVLAALRRRWLTRALIVYVDVLRALPPLVLLIFVYNAPPFMGYKISEFSAVLI